MAKTRFKEGDIFKGILNTKESHWGIGQTGIGFCEDGKVEISENKPIKSENDCPEGFIGSDISRKCFPTHKSFKCPYHGIYAYGYGEGKDIWLFPASTNNINKIKKAICNLKGKKGITGEHIIKDNSSRKVIGKVKDFCKR